MSHFTKRIELMKTTTISLTLNNKKVGPIKVPVDLMMINFLHEYVNLTGTKYGCGIGVCHACVIVERDKETKNLTPYRTCINGVLQFHGKEIFTVEGHSTMDKKTGAIILHPVQKAFIKEFAFQCGWCTPGFVNAAVAFYEHCKNHPIPAHEVHDEIEKALGHHICRCTGYVRYYSAIKKLLLSTPGLTVA